MPNALRISVILQLLLTAYFEAVSWFPLGRLNDQRGIHNRPLIEQIATGAATFGDIAFVVGFGLPAVLFLYAYSRRMPALMWLCVVFNAVWFGLQIKGWWIPYISGASEMWQRTYTRVFGNTLKVLPSAGMHLAPDAMHFVLQLLLLAVLVSSVAGLLTKRAPRSSAAAR